MKIVRSILLFFVFILGFVLQAEIFQTQLWNFDMAYYLVMRYEVGEDKIETFLKDIQNEANNNDVSVFATEVYMETNHNTILNIYGDDEKIKSDLYQTMDIKEQTYTSFLSGSTHIKYNEFNDLAFLETNTKKSLSFIGNEEDILNIYEIISDKYSVTYPEYFESTEEDMVIIVWLMIVFFVIAMNCIEVLRRKKEVDIRISLGEGAGEIIIKSVIEDVILYAIVYIIARVFVFRFISGEYAGKLAFTIFIIGAIVSFLPYIAFVYYDIRKAFSNVNDSKEVLYALYVLKIVVTALTIFTITTNLSSVHWNMNSVDTLIEQYKDYSYITLGNNTFDSSGEEMFWDEVYKKQYNILNPVICINVLKDDCDFILVNNNAKNMLQGYQNMIKDVNKDVDFIVFINEDRSLEECKNTALECLDSFLYNSIDELNIQIIQYNEKQKFSYMSSDENYGISIAENPVVIFQNNKETTFDGYNVEQYAGKEIMFGVEDEDLQKVKTEYDEYIRGNNFVVSNVYESYNFQKSFIVKLISFLSSLCMVVFILDVMVIISISSMEYRMHSMEISIKKILGYGVIERNKRIILYNLFADLIVIVVMCILGVTAKIISLKICIPIGIFIIIVEMFVLACNIIKVENENTYKVLKGGCL